MLAEKRYKVKYSSDPNGKAWADDPTRFGKRMLKSMGWNPGQGLGKNEDGIQEPIKASTHRGTRGLGLKSNYSSDFKQIDDYAQLLNQLNTINNKSSVNKQVQKHQGAKLRLGVKKSVSKDASMYDEKSLNAILGVKSTQNDTSQDSNPILPNLKNSKTEDGIKTVKSLLTVSEYFELGKKKRKLSNFGQCNAPVANYSESNDISIPREVINNESSVCTQTKNTTLETQNCCTSVVEEKSENIEFMSVSNANCYCQTNLLLLPGYCHY